MRISKRLGLSRYLLIYHLLISEIDFKSIRSTGVISVQGGQIGPLLCKVEWK